MDSSTWLGAAIIRSASSSMMITTWDMISSSRFSFFIFLLKDFRSRTFSSAKDLYRFVISATAQFSAAAAFAGSVTTGISRCGMPL